MAIDPVEFPCDEITLQSQDSSNYFKPGAFTNRRSAKINFTADDNMNGTVKHRKLGKKIHVDSPYISGDNAQLLSQLTEKRFICKKDRNITSSFPLAAKIYKANSDEFKATKRKKKVKKSVLTLPNKPVPAPLLSTVSDMNDSEYFNRDDVIRKKAKKPGHKKGRVGKDFEYYDRDALYCSQMDINLDCSSSDTIKNYNDKRKTIFNPIESNCNMQAKQNPHDVWAVLRNINRFQFQPSPQISEDSFKPKKTKRRNRHDMRVFETCTEEFAYISSIEVDKSPNNFSQSSSFDKMTVIDKESTFGTLYTGLRNGNTKKNKYIKSSSPKIYNKNMKKNSKNREKPSDPSLTNATMVCHNLSGAINSDNKITTRNNKFNSTHNFTIKQDNLNESVENKNIINNRMSHFSKCIDKTTTSNCVSKIRKSNDEVKMENKDRSQCEPQINGISKIILNNENKTECNKLEMATKREHKTITLPNHNIIMPRLTYSTIKQRLIKQKYPIVILDKDQLSSSFQVLNQEHPQFDGINEKMWPFMVQWYRPDTTTISQRKCNSSEHKRKIKYEDTNNNSPSRNGIKSKEFMPKDSNLISNKINKSKIDSNKPISVSLTTRIINQSQIDEKPKPIQKFKDRMIKLLYKKSSLLSAADGSHSNGTFKNIQTFNNNNNDDSRICSSTNPAVMHAKKSKVDNMAQNLGNAASSAVERRTWAKAKWANDFIDNIIKKIKAGAYYTHKCTVIPKNDTRESYIQPVLGCEEDVHSNESHCEITIPGFDTDLPAVEIKTLNMNEIAVKHCSTNILVHFDIGIPSKMAISTKNSSALIPIDITKSHTKIFKYNASILNSMLPAELCSIFPKMIQNILESGEQFALPPIPIEKSSSHLSTISEVTRCDSHVNVHTSFKRSIIPHVTMSPKLWKLLEGTYLNTVKTYPTHQIIGKSCFLLKYEGQLVEQLRPCLSRVDLFDFDMDPMRFMMFKRKEKKILLPEINQAMNFCRDLQPYPASDCKIVTQSRPRDFISLIEIMASFVNRRPRLLPCLNKMNVVVFKNNITFDFDVRQSLNKIDTLSLSVGNFVMDNYFLSSSTKLISNNKITLFNRTLHKSSYSSDISENFTESKNNGINSLKKYVAINSKKLRRKGFIKLHKKCKSTSNVATEKVTPLNKILNLDDFFETLGSGKLLSSIFDTESGKKIMLSIQEMKKWTREINPKQALLVLLLANKKDTSNLLRYRTLLLQGIAVNRITKINELDMEIEVIERENLNKFCQYEGITYLPASIENQEDLFEELHWIAKTTASDYQRPFDDTSEKLLKSLLEKRKKLNPSYLRVMARYVGLGLLKSPSPGKKK